MTALQNAHPARLAAAAAPGLHRASDDPAHVESIEQSHARCAALGLTRIGRPDHAPLTRSDLSVARERNVRLHLHAAPVMELLLEQTMATQSMIVLTDTRGTVLHSVGHDGFVQRASKVALAPGADWSESSKGTNAIGTALISELPTVVHGEEHFMLANDFLTCSAAPIFDPRGNLLGVLDVSGDHRSYHLHTLGLVKMSARMIENHWLGDDFHHALRLHFHTRAEFIGTLMEGIVAVGRDGRFLGANRSALDQLGLSCAALRMNGIGTLLGTSVGAVVDHFRSPMATPMVLSLADGRRLYMRAVFNWPTWHYMGTGHSDNAMVGDADDAHLSTGSFFDAATGVLPVATGSPAAPRAAPALVGLPPAAPPPRATAGLRSLQTGDARMEAVIGKIKRVLNRDISILVLGETGTGKELLARAIHDESDRARQPFVAVNCASIPENLIEAELFGYEDGAFTGARRKGAVGKIVQAHGGTLFLDEIGDMPLALQARLLRVLQERQVTPLGSTKAVPVDVAVVSATHRQLRDMIEAQTFREDLYYRLNSLVVRLPALRERSDLMTIVKRILRAECSGRAPELAGEVIDMLKSYRWPGNIRQLCNVLRTAAVMAADEGVITRDHLSEDFLDDLDRQAAWPGSDAAEPPRPAPLVSEADPIAAASPTQPPDDAIAALPADNGTATFEAVGLAAIRRAVDEAGGNISMASKRLGISRNTIYRKLRWGQSHAPGSRDSETENAF